MNVFWDALAAITLLVLLLVTCYKAFGALGNAFIITVVILTIILAIWEFAMTLIRKKMESKK
jgi:hypothetical protein